MVKNYHVDNVTIEEILGWIKQGKIGLPEMQRPFVWSTAKVRDLIDSLYNGYPIGYIVTWQNPAIGLKNDSSSNNKEIIIDGQQRLTALKAALSGEKLQEDARWKYGVPPTGNANYAWIEHIISKLAPDGKAGFVLANGALSTSNKEEFAIRKAILEDDKIDAIVALPEKMFYSTGIPVSLWFVDMNKESEDERSRKGETLFIDARDLGEMIDRTHRAFNDDDIKKVADTYHAYRGTNDQEYKDVAGFCKIAKLDEIAKNDYVLTPGRYVGLAKQEDDGEPYEVKMKRLTSELKEQFEESNKLQAQIKDVLKELGYEI